MYEVTRTYRGLGRERREQLAEALEQELQGSIAETAGLHAFAVSEQGDTITSTTVFGDAQLAERASRRPPAHPDLRPETSVREVGRGPQPQPEPEPRS